MTRTTGDSSTTATTGASGTTGRIVLDRDDGVLAIALADATLAHGLGELRWRLDPLLAGGTHTVEIDVSRVDRLSSGCIATLLWVKRTCAARQIRVVLSSPTPHTLDQLKRTGLAHVLEIGSHAS